MPNASAPTLSVIFPAHDEQDNLRPLVEEIASALDPLGVEYEIIVADDASTDATPQVLRSLMQEQSNLRALRLEPPAGGGGNGQSLAFRRAIEAARGEVLVMLDGDRQNDPADIPDLLACMKETGADLVQGDRSRNRRDNLVRRVSSLVGRAFRRWLLADTIRDTGCSLRCLRREVALRIPLEFKGMHRFIPVTARQLGYRVVERPVNHRPRVAGTTSYGVWNRALPGLWDCIVVRWMGRRRRDAESTMVLPAERGGPTVITTARARPTEEVRA